MTQSNMPPTEPDGPIQPNHLDVHRSRRRLIRNILLGTPAVLAASSRAALAHGNGNGHDNGNGHQSIYQMSKPDTEEEDG